MAGIFSIFNESENGPTFASSKAKERSTFNGPLKLKSFGNSGHTAAKNALSVKPKGLSIRSKSDLNVTVSNNDGVNKINPKECLKPKEKLCLSNSKQASPCKLKTPKSKSFSNITPKKMSPKISSPIMQNVPENFVFRKPATPKPLIKTNSLEPEKLSYDFNYNQYMNEEMQTMFDDDRSWLKSVRESVLEVSHMHSEDEGFCSDGPLESSGDDSMIFESLPNLSCDVQLPDISDSDSDSES